MTDVKGFDPVIKLGSTGKTVDVSKAVPLTIGDFRRLKKDHGVDQKDLLVGDIETTCKMMFFILHKADANITESDSELLTFKQVSEINIYLSDTVKEEVDRPT
jgi:hypothetical protein